MKPNLPKGGFGFLMSKILIKNYINPEKKSFKETTKTIINYLASSWIEILCFILFVYLFFRLKEVLAVKKEEEIKKFLEIIITSASILSAIIITYLISKAIQVRQEKKDKFFEYHKLTQQTHCFRNCIHTLYRSYNFLTGSVKSKMDSQFKNLSYFDIRKGVFVNGKALTELENKFFEDVSIIGAKTFYLEMKSFFPNDSLFDPTLYHEYEIQQYYNPELLELWQTFDPANGFWYNLENKYYKENFDFNSINRRDQETTLGYAKRFDEKKYSNAEFDRKLFVNMANQFKYEVLPKLYELSIYFDKTPKVITYLTNVQTFILAFGVIIPMLLIILRYNFIFSILSLSSTVTFLIYFVFTFYRQIKKELQIFERF